ATREAADRLIEARLAAPMSIDANDYLYAWNSSRDYNAAPGLERIQAALLAINAADDERNPPETGLMENALKRVRNGRLLPLPAAASRSSRSARSRAVLASTAAAAAWYSAIAFLASSAFCNFTSPSLGFLSAISSPKRQNHRRPLTILQPI